MLERWYDALSGEVAVGDTAVKNYQLKKGLRSNIALVGQEPVLFKVLFLFILSFYALTKETDDPLFRWYRVHWVRTLLGVQTTM